MRIITNADTGLNANANVPGSTGVARRVLPSLLGLVVLLLLAPLLLYERMQRRQLEER